MIPSTYNVFVFLCIIHMNFSLWQVHFNTLIKPAAYNWSWLASSLLEMSSREKRTSAIFWPIQKGTISCNTGSISNGNRNVPNAQLLLRVLVMLFCYRHNESCNEGGIEVKFSLVLQPCVDGSCTSNGECREYFSGVFHFSSCYCYAGKYR